MECIDLSTQPGEAGPLVESIDKSMHSIGGGMRGAPRYSRVDETMGAILMNLYDWMLRPAARIGVCLALLLSLRGEILSEMVDPAIDQPGRPFCYFSRPSTVIGVMDGPEGTQVTAEGYLYTGSAELMFFAGDPLQPAYQRIKTLVDGCIPIVQYDLEKDGVRYEFEMFAATLDGEPTSPLINFVKVRARNDGRERAASKFAVAFCWRGPRRGIHPRRAHDPFGIYWMNGDTAGRGNELIYMAEGPAPSARAFTFEQIPAAGAEPFVGQGKDGKILQDTPVCFTVYDITLDPGGSETFVFKMPYTPVDTSDTRMCSSIAAANYSACRRQTVTFWEDLFGRMMQIDLDEPKVVQAYKASVMYALVARDKIGDRYVQKVNELQYDQFYLRDCSYIARSYDLVGLHDIAAQTVDNFFNYQVESGNFESQPGQLDGWGQAMWTFGSHFEMTHDLEFARRAFPYIDRGVKWLHNVRSEDELGLLPPCGPYDNEAINGRYTGHSFWCLLGLREAVTIAKAIGEDKAAARYQQEYDDMYAAFMKQLEIATAKTGGYIPPGLDTTGGNDWGNLHGVYPSGVLPPDHPWITATMKKMRAEKYLEGVMSYAGRTHSYLTAKVTETSIIRGEQQDALSDLYGMLLHTDSCQAGYEWGIPAYGDRDFGGNFSPHGWGAMKLVSVIRDMLIREQGDDLHLLSVVSPAWVGRGKHIAVKGGATTFGNVDFSIEFSDGGAQMTIQPKYRTDPKNVIVHVPWFAEIIRAESHGGPAKVEDGKIYLAPSARSLSIIWRLKAPDKSFNKTVADYEAEYARHYVNYVADGGKPQSLLPDPPESLAQRARTFDERYKDVGLALGKPVTVTGETEGGNTPALAVDGECRDADSGWWAHPTPVSMTVDLEKPTEINRVHIYFYWGDERYYQYRVDVSNDKRAWKTIIDETKNTELVTKDGYRHGFEPLTTRYLRLTVTKNSANYASHVVEFRVLGPEG
jgi:hypothetical protein